MSCINDSIIQAYIDNEVSDIEKQNIVSHLATCEICRTKVDTYRKRSVAFKDVLNRSMGNVEFKAFKKPETTRINTNTTFKRIIYASISVAASLLFFLLLTNTPFSQPLPDTICLAYDLESDYNANLPISEQNFTVHFTDSEGNHIDF